MLHTEHMQKVRIVCLYNDKQVVTAALHRIGSVDLRKSKLDISEDTHPIYFTELSDMLIKVDGAVKLLEKRPVVPEKHSGVDQLISSVKKINDVLDRIYNLDSERRLTHEDEKLLDYGEYVAKSFAGLDINFSNLHSDFLNFKAFETDARTVREFQRGVDEAGLDVEVITHVGEKGEVLLFITYPREINVENLLKRFKMRELDLNSKYLSNAPKAVLRSISEKRKNNKDRLDKIGRELNEMSSRHYSRLVNMREMLDIEVARAEASSMYKRTEKALVVEGWVSKKRVEELRDEIKHATHGKFQLDEIEPDELAPTLIKRPKILRPFDYLMEFFSVPRSDEIDPTWVFILFFPIFYGFMVSDVGYGVASFIFAAWITRVTDPDDLLHNVAKIWRLSAVSAIVFGFLSNQYFGMQLNQYFVGAFGFTWINYITFDWLQDITIITVISVFFGITQVILGLIFSMANNYRKRNMKLFVAKFTSITTIIFGTIAIATGLFNVYSSALTLPAAAIAVVSVLITAVLSGEEALEIVSLVGHPISYARIMGFGLASVIIAILINKAFTPSLSQGPFIILYIILFIALHLFNMILAMFEGLVQGVRLNFIEFFSKFYTGGGIKFKPFYYHRRYTEDDAKIRKM